MLKKHTQRINPQIITQKTYGYKNRHHTLPKWYYSFKISSRTTTYPWWSVSGLMSYTWHCASLTITPDRNSSNAPCWLLATLVRNAWRRAEKGKYRRCTTRLTATIFSLDFSIISNTIILVKHLLSTINVKYRQTTEHHTTKSFPKYSYHFGLIGVQRFK